VTSVVRHEDGVLVKVEQEALKTFVIEKLLQYLVFELEYIYAAPDLAK